MTKLTNLNPACAPATSIEELRAGLPLNHSKYDRKEIIPPDWRGIYQALHESDLATVQEPWNMGEGQLLHYSTLRAVLCPGCQVV